MADDRAPVMLAGDRVLALQDEGAFLSVEGPCVGEPGFGIGAERKLGLAALEPVSVCPVAQAPFGVAHPEVERGRAVAVTPGFLFKLGELSLVELHELVGSAGRKKCENPSHFSASITGKFRSARKNPEK
jgi:hypothetical protein